MVVDLPPAHVSNFPAKVSTTVAAGGNASLGSPTLPATAKTATVTIKPKDRPDIFDRLEIMFAGTKSKKARLLTCVYLYAVATEVSTDQDAQVSFKATDPTLAFLFLNACAAMAAQIPASPGASAAAAGSYRAATRSVPIAVTKSGSKYSATVDGTSSRTSRKIPLKVTTRPAGNGVRLKVRPRSRSKTLRQVVGPSLAIGIRSPADAGGSVGVTATYAQPR